MDSENKAALGMFIIVGLGIIGLLLITSRPNSQYARKADTFPRSNIIRLKTLKESEAVVNEPAAYKNEEIREIEYNDLGLPTRIVIHRNARIA